MGDYQNNWAPNTQIVVCIIYNLYGFIGVMGLIDATTMLENQVEKTWKRHGK